MEITQTRFKCLKKHGIHTSYINIDIEDRLFYQSPSIFPFFLSIKYIAVCVHPYNAHKVGRYIVVSFNTLKKNNQGSHLVLTSKRD